jgi:hypothetical protein
MLSPLSSLRFPYSPIEKQAFRSRSFRRVFFAACALSLFLATLHSINIKNELHREFPLEYLSFRRNRNLFSQLRLPPSQTAGKWQDSFHSPQNKTNDRSYTVNDLMNELPEVIRIPFEEAVLDVELEGWEDDWFSSATYDYERDLAEPKLDFVYNCK